MLHFIEDPFLLQSFYIFLGLVVLSLPALFFRKANSSSLTYFETYKASLKSWWWTAPLILIGLSLPRPFNEILISLLSIWSLKTFFQMVGVFHHFKYVWTIYVCSFFLAYTAFQGWNELYNLVPMFSFVILCLLPILEDNSKHKVQVLSLVFIGFIFYGWCLNHVIFILNLPKGAICFLYLYSLSELCLALTSGFSLRFGKVKLFPNITGRIRLEGLAFSFVTIGTLSWFWKNSLPYGGTLFWALSFLSIFIFSIFGELVVSWMRRDLGLKNMGIFILGRGDILSRVSKVLFVFPSFYYFYLLYTQVGGL